MDSQETCIMAETNVDQGKSLKELDKTPSSIEDIPEDPPTDSSLLDIQMPQTPDSTKGQTSDGDLSTRLESPRTVKPVLGKLQAKKRLMAFANKFNVMKKIQTPNTLEPSALSKGKKSIDDGKPKKDPEKKLKKKTEEKILAIEEIVREEAKSKMLLAAKFTASQDGTIAGRSGKYVNRFKDRRRYKDRNISHKVPPRSPDRRRRRSEEKNEHKGSNDSRIKDESKSTQEQKVGKEKKHDRSKRDENKFRDKKDDVKENREEKKEEKKDIVSDKDEPKDKKDEIKDKPKDRSKDKEKEFVKCNNWAELKKSGFTIDDYIEFRKRDNMEKTSKSRTPQDYTRCLEQMLMLNESRIKRTPVIVEGLDGPKEYHPESMKSTKRARGPCLLYSENPRLSLLLNLQQLSQIVTIERREKILHIAEGSKLIHNEKHKDRESVRNWYRKLSQIQPTENSPETLCPTNVKFPKSKWDSDNEDTPEVALSQEKEENKDTSQEQTTTSSARLSNSATEEEGVTKSPLKSDVIDEIDDNSITKGLVNEDTECRKNSSSLLRSTSNEKLASEYEEFMKIVTSEIPLPGEDDEEEEEEDEEEEAGLPSSQETSFETKSLSPSVYPQFDLETDILKSNTDSYFHLACNLKDIIPIGVDNLLEHKKFSDQTVEIESVKLSEQENHNDENNEVEIERTKINVTSDERSQSIPSDWENVRIKVERMSDEELEPPSIKKKRKRRTSSSSSSSSSTSSESNRIKIKRKRKRKSKDSSSGDSDSSDSSTSSTTDSSSSDDRKKKKKKKKKKKRKRKAEKRKRRKAKKIAKSKKKRRRKVSTDSTSSNSDFEETKRKKKSTKKNILEKELIRSKKSVGKSIEESLTEDNMLIEPHNIKEEIDSESIKEQPLEISNFPKDNEEQSLTVNITEDSDVKKLDWEIDSLIVVGKETLSQPETVDVKIDSTSVSVVENVTTVPEVQDAGIIEELPTSKTDVGSKKIKTTDQEDRSNTEFLVDWEAKSLLMIKNKSIADQKKTSWEENDFDTLNVPSLLQLEKEVSNKQILADDWEVDSLDAIPDLLIDKKKLRNQKQLEREIKYDKQNDRYVEITKESSKENRKKQRRAHSIRIWEDEQEEGEREEMFLKEKKEKFKNCNWNIKNETLLCSRESKKILGPSVDRLGSCESTEKEWFDGPNNATANTKKWLQLGEDEIETMQLHKNDEEISKHSEEWLQESHEALNRKENETRQDKSSKCQSDKDACPLIQKITKKSRWDRSSQDGDKTDDKADVAWEEECNEWAKLVETKQKIEEIVTKPELNLLTKELRKEESTKNDLSIDQMIEKNVLNTDNLLHSADILKKSSKLYDTTKVTRNRDMHGKSWMIDQMAMDLGIDKNIDTDFENDSNILSSKGLRNKNIDMIRKTNIELYSPSSPASSQKSENSDTSDSSSSSSSSKEDESPISTSKSFELMKEENHSIPLELDFDIPKLSKDMNDELELQSHMDIFAEFEAPKPRVKKPIKVVPIVKPKEKSPTPPIVAKEAQAITKQEEVIEDRPALKLIPNQLLIRRTEPVKLKRNFDYLSDLNIQSKRRNERTVKTIDEFTEKIVSNDDKNLKTCENGETLTKRSPSRTEEKQYSNDREKEKKDDDKDRFDRRDYQSFKEQDDDRRRPSPVNSRGRRKGGSPISSWERERSGSHSRSWSRSRSRSPRRRDGKGRRRTKEKRERYGRSPIRFDSKDSRNDFTTTQDDREDWLKRKYDNLDRDRVKNTRSYDPIEMLRQRHAKPSRRDTKLRSDEEKHGLWPYEAESALRDENESIDSYNTGQEFDSENNHKSYYRASSLEREMQSNVRTKREMNDSKRGRLWNKDRDSVERFVSRKSDIGSAGASSRSSRSSPQRLRRSPPRYRRSTRSRSRSWSRSRTRSRTTSRSRSRSRGRTRSRSSSRSRFRSPDRHSRVFNRLSSRTPSPSRSRRRDRRMSRNDEDNRKRSNIGFERGRRIETIVQSIPTVTRVTADSTVLDHPEMQLNGNLHDNFQFPGESDSRHQYYYSGNNLTYPPCIDDSTTNSPKRLSLDDRLELELGIKKAVPTREYPPNFAPNSQQSMMYRQPSTVLQIGNVLQVVPTEFGEAPSVGRNETISSSGCNTGNLVRGSSQVVRVGNVLQVVPTASLDWNATSTVPGLSTPNLDPSPNKITYSSPSVSVSVPPRPSPLPVPLQNTAASVVSVPITSLSPHSLPIPISIPIPILPPTGAINFPRVEPPKIVVQPVYNYEVILETRRKEKEERKRLKDLRKKEKERKRIEKINRRALRLLEKKSKKGDNGKKGTPTLDESVISALQEDEPAIPGIEASSIIDEEKNNDSIKLSSKSSETAKEVEDEEEEEEDDPEIEDEDEEDEDIEEADFPEDNSIFNIDELEIPARQWPSLPPPPLKGILVPPDFRKKYPLNGDIDDLNLEEILKTEIGEDTLDKDSDALTCQEETIKLKKKKSKKKKSVQFADGIKPGEGTSPSGGEDMPSPPPPVPPSTGQDRGILPDEKKSRSRKNRKKLKREKPPKPKKKVKVKIITLKKPPRIPPLSSVLEDSDEMDDRSPPPPPPGSPPPPHLWPDYLQTYNTTTVRAMDTTPATLSTSSVTLPPPTPLPLLVPPPPLNYSIQPCNKT